ncbi:hypothetical protein [Sphingopyxis sp. PET50]|uniref:hypothetical protein n=1 Tax=Sphingopyxis sp. PET50 TaxID=2976533 RepID=UPI0021AF79DE|nr:hypothetical protein [Sphingopyxis sp. PET50]
MARPCGGREEGAQYFTLYAETLANYERLFGEIPPAAIWPSGWQRFHVDPRTRRVALNDVWIVPKRRVRLGLLIAAVIVGGGVALHWLT